MAATEEHIIDLKHVSKRFGDKVVLDDISLYIRKGEFVTLLGPNAVSAIAPPPSPVSSPK